MQNTGFNQVEDMGGGDLEDLPAWVSQSHCPLRQFPCPDHRFAEGLAWMLSAGLWGVRLGPIVRLV